MSNSTPTGSVDGQIDDLDKLLLEARTDEYGDSGNYNEAKLKQLILARENNVRLKLARSITTDKGDAYYQGIPLYRYVDQLQSLPNTTKEG